MVGTITLNPCIDRTVAISGFSYGGMNRISENRRDVSGKGVNVSLALMQNGVECRTAGFVYKDNGKLFLDALKDLGIDYEYVQVPGSIRENIKVWDQKSGVTTEINQSGEYVSPEDWEAFKTFFSDFVSQLDTVVLSGSIPKGLPKSAYRELGLIAREKGVRVILDAEGEVLNLGLEARPFLIKPNEYEFMVTFNPKSGERADIIEKAKEIISEGKVQMICITLGKDGAILVDKDSAWYSPRLDLQIKCTQGAGDSVVAGICKALSEGRCTEDMLRYGVAMAGGTLSREGTQICLKEDFERILPLVQTEDVQ